MSISPCLFVQGSGSGLSSDQELEFQTQLDTAAMALPPTVTREGEDAESNRQMLAQLGLLGPAAEAAAPPRRNAGKVQASAYRQSEGCACLSLWFWLILLLASVHSQVSNVLQAY